MLSKTTKDKLASYGVDVEKLEAAVKADTEQDLEFSEVLILTPDEATKRDSVKLDEGKKLGETEAAKTFVKEVGKKLNWEITGERIGDLVKQINEKVNATDNDKLTSLQEQITLLTKDKEALTAERDSALANAETAKFDNKLIGLFPANRSEGLKDEERITLLKRDISFETVDGNIVAKRNGEVMRDRNTQAPLPIDKVVTEYFTERKWVSEAASAQGGRGGNNSSAGSAATGIKSMSQAKEHWKNLDPDKNVNTMSPEFTDYVNKLAKEDPQFNMYG